ncbi:hypothetical protein GOODEAATRI_012328 [Goodea atripinnis]|uniref:Hflx-type G domain-containing protein n=1 Tax=Goodea atripinnis TaxID=208336 RepID=A0ABV0N2W8_9TELE
MKTLRFIHSRLPLGPRSCHRSAASCRLLPASHCRGHPSILQSRTLALSASSLKNRDDFGSSSHTEEEAEEDGDFLEDSEVEELFQQHVPAGIGQGQHRVFIVHPDVKWGRRKQHLTTGETLYEVQQRLLKEREMKIRFSLEKLRKKRHLLRSQRKHREFPIVNQLFATLDVTVHAGQLPSHMTVLYVDTIGFLSQLPHQLIDSFSATLEDITHSDLLVHVRDISHPETVNQKANVLNVLKNLQIPRRLLSSMIEVHNKIDLLDNYESSEPGAVLISALQEQGLEELKNAVETEIVKSTGKQILDLRVNLSTPQLRSEDKLTWTSQLFVPVQVIDHFLCCFFIRPPVWDGGPQVWMSCHKLGVIGENDLVTGCPETPQA